MHTAIEYNNGINRPGVASHTSAPVAQYEASNLVCFPLRCSPPTRAGNRRFAALGDKTDVGADDTGNCGG